MNIFFIIRTGWNINLRQVFKNNTFIQTIFPLFSVNIISINTSLDLSNLDLFFYIITRKIFYHYTQIPRNLIKVPLFSQVKNFISSLYPIFYPVRKP